MRARNVGDDEERVALPMSSNPLTRDQTLAMRPIVKQIQLGNWALLEPAVLLLLILGMVGICLFQITDPPHDHLTSQHEKSIHAH